MADELAQATGEIPATTTDTTAPPTWQEITAHPKFEQSSPEKQLVAFDRWHNDAYNYASQQADWAEHKDQFNKRAAEKQTELSNAAGGVTPDQARVKVAEDALHSHIGDVKADAIAAGQPEPTGLSSPQMREALAPLGKDVWQAYFNKPEEDQPSQLEKALETIPAMGSSILHGAGETLESAGYASHMLTDAIGNTLDPKGAIRGAVATGLQKIGLDPATVDTLQKGNALEWVGQELQRASKEGRDPRLQGSWGDIVGSAAGGVGEIAGEAALGSELLKGVSLAPRLAERVATSGVFALHGGAEGKAAAEAAGASEDKILQSFIAHAGAGAVAGAISPTAKWVQRLNEVSDGSFGRILQRATIEGGQNGLQMVAQSLLGDEANKLILHQHPEIGDDLYNSILQGGPTGFVASLVFSGLGGRLGYERARMAARQQGPNMLRYVATDKEAHPIVQRAARNELAARGIPLSDENTGRETTTDKGLIPPGATNIAEVTVNGQTTYTYRPPTGVQQNLQATGLPESAKAEGEAVAAQPEAAPPETPQIRLRSRIGANGEQSHNLDIAKEATPDQLKETAKEIEERKDIPPEAKAQFQEQIQKEIADREKAEPGPGTKVAGPVLVAQDGKTILVHGDSADADWNTHDKLADNMTGSANEQEIEAARQNENQRKFVDDKGNILDRPEAGKLADQAGQRTENVGEPLHSEEIPPSETAKEALPEGVKLPEGVQDEGRMEAGPRSLRLFTDQATGSTFSVRESKLSTEEIAAKHEALKENYRNVAPTEPVQALKPSPRVRPLPEELGGEKPEVKPPSERQVARETYVKPTEEERAARVEKGSKDLAETAKITGIIPTLDEVVDAVGRKASKEIHAKVAEEVAAQYPPETLSPGAKEVEGEKHTMTGKPLPMIEEPKLDETGQPVLDANDNRIMVRRPKFTNDPAITALQIDMGQKVYIPDEIADEDKVNPAIEYTYDKAAGKYFVTSAEDAKYGKVERPEELSKALLNRGQFQKAQANVFVDPETLSYLADHGITLNQDLLSNDVIPETGDVSTDSSGAADKMKIQANITELGRLGIDLTNTKAKALPKDAYRKLITSLVTDQKLSAGQRQMAALIADAADLDPNAIHIVFNPKTTKSGWYSTENGGQLTLNLATGHEGGLSQTFLHEAYHHVTLQKMQEGYERTAFEQRAYDNLNKLYNHVLKEAFLSNFKREGTKAELEEFAKAQGPNPGKISTEFLDSRSRNWYGLHNVIEFATEAASNPRFQKFLSGIENAPEVKPLTNGATWKTLWDNIKQSLAELFVGKPVSRNSALGQAIENAQGLITRESISAEKLEQATPEPAATTAASTSAEDHITRSMYELKAADQGMSADEIAQMSTKELENAVVGAAQKNISKETEATPNQPGWLDKSGKFHPSGDSAGSGFGNHEPSAREIIKNDPALQKEFEKLERKEGGAVSLNALYDFMEKRGYARITGEGGPEGVIYTSSKLTIAQRRALLNAAKEQGHSVVQDLGLRSKTLYEGQTADALPAGQSAVNLNTEYTKGGKQIHTLDIHPTASRAELLNMQDTIKRAPNISAADRIRLNQELAEQLGPTLTMREARTNTRFGYDSADNIANNVGRQARSSVLLDYGRAEPPPVWDRVGRQKWAQSEKDRAAANAIIEAGGNKNDLAIGIDRIMNGKLSDADKQKFAGVYQYALDNWERLAGKEAGAQSVLKAQLAREQAHGFSVGEMDNYINRMLEAPEYKNELLVGSSGSGSSRYFTKGRVFEKLYDALNAGYKPKSEGSAHPMDIAELVQRRVELGEKMVQQKLLEDHLRTIKLPDGRSIIGATDEYKSYMDKTHSRIPPGYSIVQTGGKPLVIANEIAPLMRALYADSSLPKVIESFKAGEYGGAIGGALAKAAAFAKRNTLLLDTYHVGRIMAKELFYSKGAQRFGYGKGLSILDYADKNLDRAVKSGDITQDMADYSREKVLGDMSRRDAAELLIKQGLNVGQVADNLAAQHSQTLIPGIKNFNPWVFQKLSRGAMLQTGIENFIRNYNRFGEDGLKKLPEDATEAEKQQAKYNYAARQTAKEYNEVFGNLQNQGLFTDKTLQNTLRAAILAPNWAESQARAELRGYGQALRAPIDIVRGRGIGTVAQGQLSMVLGMLMFNQVLNYLSTGHSTFQNEGDHMLDAFIPEKLHAFGKEIVTSSHGLWFSPFEIAAEYAFMAQRYHTRHEAAIDIATHIARNKLGPIGRAGADLVTGRDALGRPFQSLRDRTVGAIVDAVPFPILASSAIERDPRQPLGVRLTRRPGAAVQQVLQSAGLKTAAELSPRQHMFALAYPYKANKNYGDTGAPTAYTELRRALDNDQVDTAQSEIRMLAKQGHTADQIRGAVGWTKSGSLKPEIFTGKKDTEKMFFNHLTADQKEQYKEAQADHRKNASLLKTTLTEMMPELRDQLRENAKRAKNPVGE